MNWKNLLFLLALSFSGCQSNSPPMPVAPLQIEVYLRYLQAEQSYHAEATFRKPDSNSSVFLPFGWSGDVKFNGKVMKTLPHVDKTYRIDYSASAAPAHNIVWTNEQKQPQQIVLPLAAVDDFFFQPEKLCRRQPAVLSWRGNPIADNESLVLFWEHPEHGVVSMPVVGATPQSQIKIPAVKISELKPGKWQLYLIFKKAIKTVDNQLEVKALTEFYTQPKIFTVVN